MAGELSRRGVIGSALGAIITHFLPAIPAAPAAAAPAQAPLLAWIVGTPGEPDHEVVHAATREAAIAFRCDGCEGDDDGVVNAPGCECYACTEQGGYEATRVPEWDGKRDVTDAEWMAAGFETMCSRCGYEASRDEGGRVVRDKPVCGCCMTTADWRLVEPEVADELEAEALEAQAPTPTLKREGQP